MKKVVIIGANGQLGGEFVKVLCGKVDLVSLLHKDIDITNFDLSRQLIKDIHPNIVINTAAFHKVDECEEQVERSFNVNAISVKNLANSCKEVGASLVHFSTDYVFDGVKGSPYIEIDSPDPLNIYGQSKLAGENFVIATLEKYFLIRTAYLFGIAKSREKGTNIAETFLKLGQERNVVKAVYDQIISPTYTKDLAEKIAELIEHEAYGLYHITNSGSCSIYKFAEKIFELEGIKTKLEEATFEEMSRGRAKRPKYSVLESENLKRADIMPLRGWQEALAAYLKERTCQTLIST